MADAGGSAAMIEKGGAEAAARTLGLETVPLEIRRAAPERTHGDPTEQVRESECGGQCRAADSIAHRLGGLLLLLCGTPL
jgi:hypothetical protein